jgi:hypothetical protein
MHIYCCNEALAQIRNTLYGCTESKLKQLVGHVEKAHEISGATFSIYHKLNDAVRCLEDDDCGVDPSIHEIGPMKQPLPPHTLTLLGWEHTLRDPEESRLQLCMKKWPLACKLGFITSRDESKWDEEKHARLIVYM